MRFYTPPRQLWTLNFESRDTHFAFLVNRLKMIRLESKKNSNQYHDQTALGSY